MEGVWDGGGSLGRVVGGPGLNLNLDRRLYFSESDSIFSFF